VIQVEYETVKTGTKEEQNKEGRKEGRKGGRKEGRRGGRREWNGASIAGLVVDSPRFPLPEY
jgi:hypothetical protein